MPEPDDLGRLYRAGRPVPPADHVADADWEAYACAELPEEERARIQAHVLACGACADTARALLQMREGARVFDPAVPASARVVPFVRRRAVPWVAGLLAAGLAAIALLVPRSSPPEEVRGGESDRVAVVSPAGQLGGRPDAFTWRPHEGASGYRVKLFAEDGRVLWTSGETPGTSVSLPAEVAMPATGYWKVEAIQSGDVVATSPLTRFQLPR